MLFAAREDFCSMKQMIFGNSVQGASHKRSGKECQDSRKFLLCDNGTIIMAVADGHGSNSCPYSKSGSSIAVNVFCKVLKDLHDSYANNLDSLLTYLNREGDTRVAQSIDQEWKRRVIKSHSDNKREIPLDSNGNKNKEEIFKMYGSTLVGLMITEFYIFAFQLGDGDISYVDSSGYAQVLETDKILGTETHSLSRIDSWKKAITIVRRFDRIKAIPSLYMLTTDGFSNSYKNEEEFQKTCKEYFYMINEHGPKKVEDNLSIWLSETSEMGCGDDITMLLAYFYDFQDALNFACKNNENNEFVKVDGDNYE